MYSRSTDFFYNKYLLQSFRTIPKYHKSDMYEYCNKIESL